MAHRALVKVLRANLEQCLSRRQYGEAEALLGRLRDEDPLAVETRGLKLELLIAKQQWDEASALAEQLLASFPSSARVHYLAGRLRYRNKDYGRAIEHFAESERLHSHWVTRRWLGKAHTQKGDYDEAEALLVGLAEQHPDVALDLAWLYERREQPEQALGHLEKHLARHPNDAFASARRSSLRARMLSAAEAVAEVDSLLDLGEEIPAQVVPTYVQRLLETGQGAAARHFIAEHGSAWPARTAAAVAWVCHRLQAYDAALQLFLQGLESHTRDFKYLSAVESAAKHCARLDDVARAYRVLARRDAHLYGRLKSLEKRLAKRSGE
jgi:tetratricopeptide (TPR) repeat protein